MSNSSTRLYRTYVLAGLTAVYMLNLVDRGLMILLLQPIKEDLNLSDTQLGFTTGIAFGLFYATLGLPMARWADRGNRVNVTSLAIGLWGITVMACLLVSTYAQLVLARIAAAVGESGCKPPTYSLVGDYFPEPAERVRAMSVYLTGGPLAALISFTAGGWLNQMFGWRFAFFVMGIPALLLAILIKSTIREPRSNGDRIYVVQRREPTIREVLLKLWCTSSLRHLCVGLVLFYVLGAGLSPWYAVFMVRSHGMNTGELGIWLGFIFSLSGVGGVLLGAYVANRWFAKDDRAQMRMSAITVVSLIPFFLAFLTLPQKHHALMALAPVLIAFSFFLGPTYALLQRLVVDEMRATMMATVMLLANLIGMGVGPQVVGFLSDAFAGVWGTDSLRYAMLVMSTIAVWSGYHFWQAGHTVCEDLRAAQEEQAFA